MDISDIPSGLIGGSDANDTYYGDGTGGTWIADGTGNYFDPNTGCYTNRGGVFCNWAGFEETYGNVSSADAVYGNMWALSLLGNQPYNTSSPQSSNNKPQKPGLLAKVCSALPQGQVLSAGGALGALGAVGGSVNLVTNYNTGQTTLSFSGSLGGGWNGAASGSVSAGYIFSSSQFSNSNYSGQFNTLSGSTGAGLGGYISRGGGVTVVGASMGASLIPSPTGGMSISRTSPQIGSSLLSAFLMVADPAVAANTLVKAACNAY